MTPRAPGDRRTLRRGALVCRAPVRAAVGRPGPARVAVAVQVEALACQVRDVRIVPRGGLRQFAWRERTIFTKTNVYFSCAPISNTRSRDVCTLEGRGARSSLVQGIGTDLTGQSAMRRA